MDNPDKFIDDGETSVPLDDVGPVTKEEEDRADEFLSELFE